MAHPPHQTERDIKQELKPEGGAMGARKWVSVAVEGSLAVVLGIALIVGILSGWSWLSGASPNPHCTLRFQNYIEHHLLVDGKDHISCRRRATELGELRDE